MAGVINQANPNGGGGLWEDTSCTSGLPTVNRTFAGWSGGVPPDPAYMLKYAVRGATSPVVNDGVADSTQLTPSNFSVTAIVRTNDPSLTVTGYSNGSLSGSWTTNGVVRMPDSDQAGVPEGFQRQVFSVSCADEVTKFLRLEVKVSEP